MLRIVFRFKIVVNRGEPIMKEAPAVQKIPTSCLACTEYGVISAAPRLRGDAG